MLNERARERETSAYLKMDAKNAVNLEIFMGFSVNQSVFYLKHQAQLCMF